MHPGAFCFLTHAELQNLEKLAFLIFFFFYLRKTDRLVQHKGLKQKICSRKAHPQRQLGVKAPRH